MGGVLGAGSVGAMVLSAAVKARLGREDGPRRPADLDEGRIVGDYGRGGLGRFAVLPDAVIWRVENGSPTRARRSSQCAIRRDSFRALSGCRQAEHSRDCLSFVRRTAAASSVEEPIPDLLHRDFAGSTDRAG